MTNSYLQSLLSVHRAPTGPSGPGERVRRDLQRVIVGWAGQQLLGLSVSGSYAKQTAIRGGTDVDLFASLRADTSSSLKDIYLSLAAYLPRWGYTVRQQNVSLGITHQGLKVDITPGRRQTGAVDDHSLYVRRLDTWMQTNVATHVRVVGGSGYTDAIVLLKRWRECQQLEFLSFALELAALRGLSEQPAGNLETQLVVALTFFRDQIRSCQLLDPANSNNNLADELTSNERLRIANAAARTLAATTWQEVIW